MISNPARSLGSLHAFFLVLLSGAAALAQPATPPGAPPVAAAVERYLAEKDDAAAAAQLDAIVARADAPPADVLASLPRCDAPLAKEMSALVPYRGQLLATTIRVPEGHSRGAARLPVVFDIGNGGSAPHLRLDKAIVAWVEGYTPPEFSDEGRDGFLKVLRWVAHLAHGDPERLWLCGFSWAGHASFDTAMHRPEWVRGIAALAGAPRHVHFRVHENLRGAEVLAFCGAKDDPVLVWNLQELARIAPAARIACKLEVDPAQGHDLPLAGMDAVRERVDLIPGAPPKVPSAGVLAADGIDVESPLLRIDAVDEARVKVPSPIPVSGSLSLDGQRRAALKAVEKKVVRLRWKIEDVKDARTLTLESDGVRKATLSLREPLFVPGHKLIVRTKGRTLSDAALTPDIRTLLAEARRTGERLRPAWRTVQLTF